MGVTTRRKAAAAGETNNTAEGSDKVYTWDELKKHNAYNDAWIAIHGKAYDITQWSKRHPGGDIILLGAGTDSTVMFEQYHPAPVSAALLDKFCVGTMESKAVSSFYNWEADKFYAVLRKRVNDYFVKSGKSRHDPWQMYVKTFLILSGFALCWYGGMYHGSFVAAALLGVFSSLIGTSVMHDANHGAYSSMPWINTIMGAGMDLIGASTYVWEFHHNTGHHPFTNLMSGEEVLAPGVTAPAGLENDPDVFSSYPLLRFGPHNERSWYHRWQHIYGPVIFGLFTMGKVLYSDLSALTSGEVNGISMNARLSNPLYLARIVAFKVASSMYMLLLPMYWHGALTGLGLFATAHFACGLILAVMFIVTHISEEAEFLHRKVAAVESSGAKGQPSPAPAAASAASSYESDEQKGEAPVPEATPEITGKTDKGHVFSAKGNIAKAGVDDLAGVNNWAAIQCRTSVNWDLDSFFWTHFSGGLNHQIEHHLFPSICHIHYPAIRPIVEETCREFGVPYVAYPSLGSAFMGTLNHMYTLGQKD